MKPYRRLATAPAASALLLGAALAACGTEPEPSEPCATTGNGPLYALATSIFDSDGATTYVSILESLDVQSVPLDQAQEHGGFATIGAIGGKLFVGDGEAPEISRYAVGTGCTLNPDGRLSFANYGPAVTPLYKNVFVDTSTAYMQLEESRRIVWNPSAMEISGVADAPGLAAERDGLVVKAGFDRSTAVRDGYSFQPFYWTDSSFYRFSPGSQIAVYSNADDRLVKLLDAPCPGLDMATRDENGNLYFSNWVFSAAAPVLEEGAPDTCAVRVKAGELAVDESWTHRLSEIVGGRQIAGFRYLSNQVGIVAVLHDEQMNIDENTTPSAITSGSNWRLWRVNLETGTGAPIEGLGGIAGGYYAFVLDGRTFLLLPSADYAKTTVYELGVTGAAEPRFETLGWAYQLVKLR
ncbi:MxcI [Vitiosangium sp. GDMCC 1.1324]|uniref:MxcI n=1 Tax=Vitiosangium sp. (strain GDMCC 1.1324) TaxID=2138576 RepID=UPI000D35B4F2|nr:MxcI [Vitiosangium sp. GDMCC 1.1324]PTL84461.1 MxcI [Vitiosangium sp. GDMCC 1.1324]